MASLVDQAAETRAKERAVSNVKCFALAHARAFAKTEGPVHLGPHFKLPGVRYSPAFFKIIND